MSQIRKTAVETLFSFAKPNKKFVKQIRQSVAFLIPEPVLKTESEVIVMVFTSQEATVSDPNSTGSIDPDPNRESGS
jgi:hypothetical protein